MIGPGIVMAGSAIGSGEWLLGPAVTARYGGALLWVTTLSVLGQLVYNLEATRYTLYCGEPILAGKFRLAPGPAFWLLMYLALDLGAVLPYQITHAATAALSLWRGAIPDPEHVAADAGALAMLSYALLAVAMLPLLVGGKVYDSLRAIMTVKIVFVLGFLLQQVFAVQPNKRGWPEWTQLRVQGIGPDTWAFFIIPTGEQWRYLILPAVTLACVSTALATRSASTSTSATRSHRSPSR